MAKIPIVKPLTYKHTANWRRAIEKRRPDGDKLDNLVALPTDYFVELAIDAAFEAGWFGEATQEHVEALTVKQATVLAGEIWRAYGEAYSADPN